VGPADQARRWLVVAVVVAEAVAAAILADDVAAEEDVQVDVDEGASVVVLVDAHA
jgi:hypothetical protein